jgi:hypothetical protein
MPWDTTLVDSQILAVHAAFVGRDTIIFFGGDEFDPAHNDAGKYDAARLFDCNSFAVTYLDSPRFDAFCCGHALSADGALLIAGGTANYPAKGGFHTGHFPGLRDSAVFRLDHAAQGWAVTALLSTGISGNPDGGKTGGRWYPTLLTLANGNVIALSGHPAIDDNYHSNFIPEVFTPDPAPSGAWQRLALYKTPPASEFEQHQTPPYPRAHLLPTGDIFLATRTSPDPLGALPLPTCTLSVKSSPWSGEFHRVTPFTPEDEAGGYNDYAEYHQTSVLLPLLVEDGHTPRVLILGAQRSWTIDLEGWAPGVTDWDGDRKPDGAPTTDFRWVETPSRQLVGSPRRSNGHAVLLPTGEVLVVGGVQTALDFNVLPPAIPPVVTYFDSQAVMTPEIYSQPGHLPAGRPIANHWTALTAPDERATVVRNYHSVALLMRDGRVWTAGSDHDAGAGAAVPPAGNAEHRIEIYEPWYWGNPNRPTITAAPDRWHTGGSFRISTTQAADIVAVALVRCGSVTHGFNADQRYVTLPFSPAGGDAFDVDVSVSGNVLPTGMYFLYTINRDRLPSDGITLYFSNDPESDAEKAWDGLFGGG